jgi:putative ABC transport system permease protein
MNLRLLISNAFRSLRNHKIRSFLTTLGIIIGVVSIIAVMSIGEGAKYKVSKEIEKLGTNFILVLGSSPKSVTQRSGVGYTLKPKDLNSIKEECPDIEHISPGAMSPVKAVYENTNWQTMVGGVNDEYALIRQFTFEKGDFFTNQDVRAGNKVAIIGQTVKRELFGNRDPIGEIIRIKKLPFKIIGLLPELGKTPDGRDQDDIIFAPVTTVQRKILGKFNYSAFMLSTKTKDRLAPAAEFIRALLRQNHHLLETDDDDFTIFTQDDISKATEAASSVLNLLLFIIASISLIVGGIGIMNIMLVSVSERTREIGIRMAIGATTFKILTQFILEAITICLVGGFSGIIFGVTIAKLIGFILGWPIFISIGSILISLSSSVLIGLFFGFYPAYKASQLNVVEALVER